MKRIRLGILAEMVVIIALMGAFLWFTLGSAHGQEPTWIEYDQLELQRRQTEALERMDQRQEYQQWMMPLYRDVDPAFAPHTQEVPACDPYIIGGCY